MMATILTILCLCILEHLYGCAAPISLSKYDSSYFIQHPKNSEKTIEHKIAKIYCKPLYLTDIEFANDSIVSVNAGDSVRWLFQNVPGQNASHLLIKPKDNDISTNAVILTAQNTYHLNLVSDDAHIGSGVYRFNGCDKNLTFYPKCLNDHYSIMQFSWFDSMPKWAPSYIYNDGTHVYIQMPDLTNIKVPILYELDEDNNLFLLNYYFRNNHYVVDHIFYKALLITQDYTKDEEVIIQYDGNI